MISTPRLVNNQFNSPIKLYSPESIQETLERQTQVLANGAVGIDFNKLSKPANLQNSAVLRMLEEEEQRKRLGKPGLRRVEWPPTKEGNLDCVDFVEQSPVQSKTRGLAEYACTYQNKSPTLRERDETATPKAIDKPNDQASVSEPSQSQEDERSTTRCWTPSTAPSPRHGTHERVIPVRTSWKSEEAQTSPMQTTTNKPKSWAPVSPTALSSRSPLNPRQQTYIVPVNCSWKSEASQNAQANAPSSSFGSPQPKEYLIPVSCPWKNETHASPSKSLSFDPSPSDYVEQSADLPTLNTWQSQSQTQQQQQRQREYEHVEPDIQIKQTPPTPTLGTWSDKPRQFGIAWNDYPRQHTLTVNQEIESPQPYCKPQSTAAHLEPPATLITLRAEPPISQEPCPVYLAQPAATNAAYDGINMRGDQKWPPASVKEQTEAENRARIELAKGPVFRPRKVNKDYSNFFAQHAVTNNYPGYRAPPGTQFFTPAYQH